MSHRVHRQPGFLSGRLLALLAMLSGCSGPPEVPPPYHQQAAGRPPPPTTATLPRETEASRKASPETSRPKPKVPAGPAIGVALFASSFREPDGPLRYSYPWTGRVVRLFDPAELNVVPVPMKTTVTSLDEETLKRLGVESGKPLDFLVIGTVEVSGWTRARIAAFDLKRQLQTVLQDVEHRQPSAAVELAAQAQLEELAQYWSDLAGGERQRLTVQVESLHSPQEVDVLLELLAALRGVEVARHASSTVDDNDKATSIFHLFVTEPPRTLEVLRWQGSLGAARLEQVGTWQYRAVYGNSS